MCRNTHWNGTTLCGQVMNELVYSQYTNVNVSKQETRLDRIRPDVCSSDCSSVTKSDHRFIHCEQALFYMLLILQ